jgi:hypothetical protein
MVVKRGLQTLKPVLDISSLESLEEMAVKETLECLGPKATQVNQGLLVSLMYPF